MTSILSDSSMLFPQFLAHLNIPLGKDIFTLFIALNQMLSQDLAYIGLQEMLCLNMGSGSQSVYSKLKLYKDYLKTSEKGLKDLDCISCELKWDINDRIFGTIIHVY